MKKVFFLFLVLTFLLAPAYAQKPRIAVVDFENRTSYGGWRLGYGAADMLATALVKTGAFRVLEREKLNAILKEQNLGRTGRIDPATAVKIGKLLGVQYIITGAVTEFGVSSHGAGGGGVSFRKKDYKATVDIRAVDTTTGEIVFADNASSFGQGFQLRIFGFGGGESYDEKKATAVMRGAIDELAAKLAGSPALKKVVKLPPKKILVADVDGKLVTLNQGSSAGLSVGDTLGIYRKAKVIKDPATGKVLKIKYHKIGTIKLTSVEANVAEGEILSGTGIKIGDEVRK